MKSTPPLSSNESLKKLLEYKPKKEYENMSRDELIKQLYKRDRLIQRMYDLGLYVRNLFNW